MALKLRCRRLTGNKKSTIGGLKGTLVILELYITCTTYTTSSYKSSRNNLPAGKADGPGCGGKSGRGRSSCGGTILDGASSYSAIKYVPRDIN